MKWRLISSLFLAFSLCSLVSVHAQETASTPEPGTRADNECYTGGTMAGKCDHGFHADGSVTPDEIEWAWRCGWYMARFNDGLITREKVPSDCGILLPGLPSPDQLTEYCGVFFGGGITMCLKGNLLRQDIGNDGTFEDMWYVVVSSIPGDGHVCPVGTIYGGEIAPYASTEPAFHGFMLSHGFKDTDDFCTI